jgi:hypothetical protein
MSGVDLPARDTDGADLRVRKGAAAAVLAWVQENGGGSSNGMGVPSWTGSAQPEARRSWSPPSDTANRHAPSA